MSFLRISKNLLHLFTGKPGLLLAEIWLTYKCNQRCLQCNIPLQEVENQNINIEEFKTILKRLSDYGTRGIILSGGEPTMHSNLSEMMQLVSDYKFMYRHILSNLYLTEKRMQSFSDLLLKYRFNLTISFDGLNETADKIRGTKNTAQIIMKNMDYLNEINRTAKHPIKTTANIVISALNLQQIPEIVNYLERSGWMINLDLYRNSSHNHNQIDEMVIQDFQTLENILNQVKHSRNVITPGWLLDGYIPYLKNEYSKQCPYLENTSLASKFIIYPDGNMRVCIGEALGNIIESNPKDIFISDQWQKAQDDFKNCPGCWNTCYTPSAKLSNYFRLSEIKNIFKMLH